MRGIYACRFSLVHVVASALVGFCLLLCTSWSAEAAGRAYIDFARYDSYRALSAGTARDITFQDGSARLAHGRTTGTLTSPIYPSTHKDTFIPSWNALTPPENLSSGGDEGSFVWNLDSLVADGRLGQGYGYGEAPQRKRTEGRELAG